MPRREAGAGLRMVREDLADIPQFGLPPGFSLRWFRPGDEAAWIDIHVRADAHNEFPPGRFAAEFGTDPDVIARRQCYLCNPAGEPIGTTTAWFADDYKGRPYGRVHWVAILPGYQGRGLAKPMLSAVMNRLVELGHVRAMLTTNEVRLPAIGLYLKFGFRPDIDTEEDLRAWRRVRGRLPNSPLAAMDLGKAPGPGCR